MLFNPENRGDLPMALLGACIVALVIAVLTAMVSSFWLGWFTPAFWGLFGQTFLGVAGLAALLALLFEMIGIFLYLVVLIPAIVVQSARDESF